MTILRKIIKKFKKIKYGDKYVLADYENLTMLLRATNHVDRKMLGGSYEREQINKVINFINDKKIDYFVDVGANIGIYSLRIAKECNELKKVVSIEAQIENYNQLCGNIRLNSFDGIIDARHIGASDQAGEIEFLVNKGSSTGTSRVKKTAPRETKLRKFNPELIAVDSLDNIIKGLKNKSIFLKIDVEGHERNVLLGMENILRNNHCFFQIEILDDNCKRVTDGFNLNEIDKIGDDVYFESVPEKSNG